VPFDAADLMQRIVQLEADLAGTSERLSMALRKEAEGLKIALDLRSRAEIKAQASAEHAERQKAAIAALRRLIAHFQQNCE
jgi:RNA:NAD 2'-phosphotransferase (TPT1/KptA family)